MYEVTIESSDCPGRTELVAACEAAAWSNVRWYLNAWAAGRDPPCCLELPQLRYRPDEPARRVRMLTGSLLLARGHASCGELAAMLCGRLRAAAIRAGADLEAARHVAWVELVERGPEVFHAVVRLASGGLIDPTEGRRRG